MVKLIILRHGFSKTNKEKRFTGQLDVPLDEIGVLQAKVMSEYIKNNFKVDSIYSSDLSRAYNSVKPLADSLNLEITKCKELREVHLGNWQGKAFEDIKKDFPESYARYIKNPALFRFEGGENYSDTMLRATDVIKKIAKDNEGKTVVIATHGGVIRTLVAAWKGIPIEKSKEINLFGNCSITVVEYSEDKVEFVLTDYRDHLTDITTDTLVE